MRARTSSAMTAALPLNVLPNLDMKERAKVRQDQGTKNTKRQHTLRENHSRLHDITGLYKRAQLAEFGVPPTRYCIAGFRNPSEMTQVQTCLLNCCKRCKACRVGINFAKRTCNDIASGGRFTIANVACVIDHAAKRNRPQMLQTLNLSRHIQAETLTHWHANIRMHHMGSTFGEHRMQIDRSLTRSTERP